MSILSKSAKVLTVLSLGFLSTQVLAQTESFCNETGHSGQSAVASGDQSGNIGSYHYEQWRNAGNGNATFYSDGSFTCSFTGGSDYLCRSGFQYGQFSGKSYKSVGHLYADYSLKKFTGSNVTYAYVGIYGWTQGKSKPSSSTELIEWYIVDNWGPGNKPSWNCESSQGGRKVGTVTLNGGTYDICTLTANRTSIEGNTAFTQYWSIRQTQRTCGTIDITGHFDAWESYGLKMGPSLYEAKILGEAGQFPENGNASGEIDFNYAKVYIGDGTTPTSSASTNPTSSSAAQQNLTAVGSLPGTLEFEDFQNKDGGFTNGGTYLGDIEPGDWAEYTVTVTYPGTYNFDLTAARGDDEGRKTSMSLSIGGTSIATISDILTDGWDDYKSFTGTTAKLEAGTHTLRVEFTGGYVNVDNIKFTEKDVDKSTPYVPTSAPSQNTDAIAIDPRVILADVDVQVFDMQGKFLGRVSVAKGGNVAQAVKARVQKAGVYLVKQGSSVQRIAVK